MEALTKTRAIGGSLVVTIPKEIVVQEGLKKNQKVEINIEPVKRNFFGALKNIKSFTKEDELKSEVA